MAVAEELSFSRAAVRLNLSQPPLSRHIKALEDKLGTPLLKRDTQSVSLTKPGAILLADGRVILRHLDRAAEAVQRAGKGEEERLNVVSRPRPSTRDFRDASTNSASKTPGVQLRMQELDPPQLVDALQDGTLQRRLRRQCRGANAARHRARPLAHDAGLAGRLEAPSARRA